MAGIQPQGGGLLPRYSFSGADFHVKVCPVITGRPPDQGYMGDHEGPATEDIRVKLERSYRDFNDGCLRCTKMHTRPENNPMNRLLVRDNFVYRAGFDGGGPMRVHDRCTHHAAQDYFWLVVREIPSVRNPGTMVRVPVWGSMNPSQRARAVAYWNTLFL